MLELEEKELYIHKVMPNKHNYTLDQKLFDLISLASAPGIGSSNSIYRKIQRRIDFEKGHNRKKAEKLRQFRMNGFDEHLFAASQQNKGILLQKNIDEYAKYAFTSDETRKAFLDYTKFRLGYLSYLDLLNDTTEGDRFYEEKIAFMDGDKPVEHTAKIRLNYRYEVNISFFKYLQAYRRQKEKELRDKFEFGRFDAYIYSFLQKNNGNVDLEVIKQEKLAQAKDNTANIIYPLMLMKQIGYLEEKQQGIFQFAHGFKDKVDNDAVYLNTAEKKIVEFIQRHGMFSVEKYGIHIEAEAENYTNILKGRLDKLTRLGLVKVQGDKYRFSVDGEQQLKAYYAESYEFTAFDRNILNSHCEGIFDLNEISAELEIRYNSDSAAQTLERQMERLFIMECAGIVRKETESLYSLTGKGAYILEEENRISTEEKRELLKQTFKYSDSEEDLYRYILSRGGTIKPQAEINSIIDTIDKGSGMAEIEAYNMLMRNYKCLGTADIDVGDEVKLNVKLGYILQNRDGTLALTPKGKSLVNAINSRDGEKRQKAFANKKFRLLNDIDKHFNRLDPKIYLKTQKIIKDKELRKIVNLLRYKPEKLYLLGLLDKNDDNSYSVNQTYEQCSQEYKAKKLQEEMDGFNFSNVHKFILKFCRNNEFSMGAYRQYMSRKLSDKAFEREMGWKRSSLEKLTRVGYFTRTDDNTYRLTEKGIQKLEEIRETEKSKKLQQAKLEKEKALKEFVPGKGYRYLLEFAKDGVLDYSDIEKRLARYNTEIRERETNIKKRMLNKLAAAGYLEPLDGEVITLDNQKSQYETGLFRLTRKAVEFMEGRDGDEVKADKEPAEEKSNQDTLPYEAPEIGFHEANSAAQAEPEKQAFLKITKFDLDNIVRLSKDGLLGKDAVSTSPKRASVEKRIETLVTAGLLIAFDDGWKLAGELLNRADIRERLNAKREQTHSIKLDMDCLTAEQKKTITDIKDFLNLTGSQILKYIYSGNEVLYKADMRYLLEKDILAKDSVYEIFVLTKKGSCLASDLTGDHNIFSSKIYSRREELKHDVLIYTAYKDMEKQLTDAGKAVSSIKTDRVLRSEDMKEHNRMNEDYPDLRIDYEDKETGEKGFVNIEVDVGYSEKVIAQKLRIPNLRWYTNHRNQREKVLKKARYMQVKIIDAEYWKRI
jgi:predicted transcriptional regulator